MQLLTATCYMASLITLTSAYPITPLNLSTPTSSPTSTSTNPTPTRDVTPITTTALPPPVTSIQRPILKDTLYGTGSPLIIGNKCGPVCIRFAPGGECLETIDGCSWQDQQQQQQQQQQHSGLSRLATRDRIIAVVLAGFAASFDWRLSVVILFGAGLSGRLSLLLFPAAQTAAAAGVDAFSSNSTREGVAGDASAGNVEEDYDGLEVLGVCSPVCVQVNMHGQCIKMIPNCHRG